MKVLVTGSSRGIGRAIAIEFLKKGDKVIGLDKKKDSITQDISVKRRGNYKHIRVDIKDILKEKSKKGSAISRIKGINILVNNAGVQKDNIEDIKVNLLATIDVTKCFAFQKRIKSVLFISSISSITGDEFAYYAAGKGGVNSYMKYCAIKLANKYRATCNALCPGGVRTLSNKVVMRDKKLWKSIMKVTPLKRWSSVEEVARWAYFLCVTNKSMTGETLPLTCGERNCERLFVWKKGKKS